MERPGERVLNPELAKTHLDAAEVERLEHALQEYNKGRPTIDDFADIRTQTDREKDLAYIEKRKQSFVQNESEIQRNADALEMVLMEFASSWMPGYASRTSEYDDMVNHADLVLEMENENDQILRIAVDATCSRAKTAPKIRGIVEGLRQGHLAKLKYFKSELDDSRDKKFLPQVVLGSDEPESLTSLIRLYLNYREAKDPGKRTMYRRAIEEHPVGREVFAETEYQLKRTVGILRSADVPDENLDKKVGMVEAIIAEFEAFKKKKAAPAHTGAQSRNGVMAAIFRALPAN